MQPEEQSSRKRGNEYALLRQCKAVGLGGFPNLLQSDHQKAKHKHVKSVKDNIAKMMM
jgi:hypothetical protein